MNAFEFQSRLEKLLQPQIQTRFIPVVKQPEFFTQFEKAQANFQSIGELLNKNISISPEIQQFNKNIEFFANTFNKQIHQSMTDLFKPLRTIAFDFQQIALPINKALQDINSQTQIAGKLLVDLIPKFSFPSLLEYIERRREVSTAQDALATELEVVYLIAYYFPDSFWIKAHSISKRVQKAYIAREFTALTKSTKFRTLFENSLNNSVSLRKRKRILLSAYEAHIDKKYELSIPIWMIQIEGLITDELLRAKEIYRERNKVFSDKSKIKTSELRGMDKKIKHSYFEQQDEEIQAIKLRITKSTNGLASQRNSILHGVNTSYPSAFLSSELLFIAAHLVSRMEE